MSLIVEDGTGLAGAESYCSVADFRTLCGAVGLNVSAVSDERAEQLLRQATEFLAGYDRAWKGRRVGAAQALDWPRADVEAHGHRLPAYVIPGGLVGACARLAYKAISGPLTRDIKPQKTRVKVGPIETEVAPGTPQATQYLDVTRMLAPYLRSASPYAVKLVRN